MIGNPKFFYYIILVVAGVNEVVQCGIEKGIYSFIMILKILMLNARRDERIQNR